MTKINLFLKLVVILLLSGCTISKEIRIASSKLVEKQISSLESHSAFHKTVAASLTQFLDVEEFKSEKMYLQNISTYEKSLLEELETIHDNATLNATGKIVKEEESRQEFTRMIEDAKINRLKRNSLIKEAKENLENASSLLLQAETAKTKALVELDKYLQEKRPSEKILELINPFLKDYQDKIDSVKEKINKAATLISSLK